VEERAARDLVHAVVRYHQLMHGSTVVRDRQAMRAHDALIGKDLYNRLYYAQRDMVQQIVESARNKYEFLLFVVKAVTSTVFATRSTSLGGCACKGEGCVRGCGVMWCCALLVRVTQLDIQ